MITASDPDLDLDNLGASNEHDPRDERWERRLQPLVIAAALAVLPLLALSLTHPHGIWHTVEQAGHWAVWTVFCAETVIMLSITRDRGAWARKHRFELLVVVVSSPLVPLALAVAPAVRLLVIAKAFKTLKLAKAIKIAKLGKSVRLLHARLSLGAAAAFGLVALALVLGALTLAYMLFGVTPLRDAEETVILAAVGATLTVLVARWGTRRSR